jgi:hypothetical protein
MKTEKLVTDGNAAAVLLLDPPGIVIPGGNMIGIDAGLGRMDDLAPRDRDNAAGPRCGGAIIAASGSTFSLEAPLSSKSLPLLGGVATIVVGGGPIGLAISAGSSPGNTHTFNLSS